VLHANSWEFFSVTFFKKKMSNLILSKNRRAATRGGVEVLSYPTLPDFRNSIAFGVFLGLGVRPSTKNTKYMSTERWWIDNDRGKLKYLEKNLSRRHLVQQKYHTD
jgi:hypothetical protein